MRLIFLLIVSLMLATTTASLAVKTSAIVEDSWTHLVVSKSDHLVMTSFKRIIILEEDGYRNAVFQDYHDSFRNVKRIEYTIYDALNKPVKRFSKSDVLDIMLNPSYEVNDARLLFLDPEYRVFPFTVEISVEAEYNGFLSFPVWMPRYTHNLEVKKASFSVACFDGFKIRARELNGVQKPVVSHANGITSTTWSVANLPAAEKHLIAKSFHTEQPNVHVSPINFSLEGATGDLTTWADFGDWFYQLNYDRCGLGVKTRKYLDGLKDRFPEPAHASAIAREVYQYMQQNTRYISIQLGIGGFQAIPAEVVDKQGYGDCKALTNYLKVMLSYMGISSNYILVNAGEDAPEIIADFPSSQFNHVFLAVPLPKDTLWFECTSQISPPGYIGTFTDDRAALWITKGNSKIIHTPKYGVHDNIKSTDYQILLAEQGDATMTVHTKQTGIFFDEFLIYKNAAKDKVEKHNYTKFNIKDFSIQSFEFSTPMSSSADLVLDFKLKVNGLTKILGNKMIVSSNFLIPVEKEFEIDQINKKAEIRRGFTIQDHVEIILPAGYHVNELPPTTTESTEFGEVKMTMQMEGDIIRIQRNVILQKGNYQKTDFDRFSLFVKKIHASEQTRLIVQSKT